MVIGKPIKVPRLEDPTHEDVQKYLCLFIYQLQTMYDKYKRAAGYPDSRLEIL